MKMGSWEWHMIEEEKALRALRKVVDGAARKLKDEDLDELAAIRLMDLTRNWVMKVFPDKMAAYDIIYKPRLEKIFYGAEKQ
jgi:hypothetical protein